MRIRAKDVAETIAKRHRLTLADITGPCRRRSVARPRQIAMYAIRKLCPHMSLPMIGRVLGHRDHTTVLHGVRKLEELMAVDGDIADEVAFILSFFRDYDEDVQPASLARVDDIEDQIVAAVAVLSELIAKRVSHNVA